MVRNRIDLAFTIGKAFMFAHTAKEQGYKYGRAVTCLGSVLEKVVQTLTPNERRMLDRKIDRLGRGIRMTYYDYLDCLNEIIEAFRGTRWKYLSGCITLAANVPELEDEEEERKAG